jgi:hypothetical protein
MTNGEALTEYGSALGFVLSTGMGRRETKTRIGGSKFWCGKGTLGRRYKSADFSVAMNTKTSSCEPIEMRTPFGQRGGSNDLLRLGPRLY